jgi:hypothetical protein
MEDVHSRKRAKVKEVSRDVTMTAIVEVRLAILLDLSGPTTMTNRLQALDNINEVYTTSICTFAANLTTDSPHRLSRTTFILAFEGYEMRPPMVVRRS